MPPLSDTDVLDHPGLNTSILQSLTSSTFVQITTIHVFLQSLTSSTFVQITTIHVFLQSLTWSACILFYLPHKGSPWDTEFCCPLVMADLSQCLGSRVPPPDLAPPLSLALMYNHVAWDQLWVPPCTLLRVLFEQSCTNTINTCILHIFDVFDIITIYSTCILNILFYDIPLYDSNPDESLGGGLGGRWDPTLDASPHLDGSFTKSSLFIFFLSSFLGVCFVLAIFMSTNSKNQITTMNTTKWCCAMTSLIDERVIAHYYYYTWYLLLNEESHCTASFHGVRGCYLNLLVCTHKNVLG